MTPDFQIALQVAFHELRSRGYFAEQIWGCCNTCGTDAVPDQFANKFVFYHEQEAVSLCERDEVNLNWAGDGNQITKAFRRQGLTVEWNGKPEQKICVSAPLGYKYVHPDDRIPLAASASNVVSLTH